MRIRNFRCFGPRWSEIQFDPLTALVGANGTGKTAVLHALARGFGTTDHLRRFVRDDFHVPHDQNPEDYRELDLTIEYYFEFDDIQSVDDERIPHHFRHVIIAEEGKPLTLRYCLDAQWSRGNTPEGNVESQLWIVRAPPEEDEDEPPDEFRRRVSLPERRRIQVHYVPAARSAADLLRTASTGTLPTLVQAIEWSDDERTAMTSQSNEIAANFRNHRGVKTVEDRLSEIWDRLHRNQIFRDVLLQPIPGRFEDILARVEPRFQPGQVDVDSSISRLSEGQQSLFYMTLVKAISALQQMTPDEASEAGLNTEELLDADLSIVALEEPENHLSPHYLGRIMSVIRDLVQGGGSQAIISSHSASILRRVNVPEIRYLRLLDDDRTSSAAHLRVPKQTIPAKFIQGAVQAYPEVYFARFVVLGEGQSEELVIPQAFEAADEPHDAAFISVVPLAGAHVNHMWNLLRQMEIPYATLLDLDTGRGKGGWNRIKYVLKELLHFNIEPADIDIVRSDGTPANATIEWIEDLPDAGDGYDLQATARTLRKFDIFFNQPLDLDHTMMTHFAEAYRGTTDQGPNIPDGPSPDADERARKSVLGEQASDSALAQEDRETWYWYRTLFSTRSKPATHVAALQAIQAETTTLDEWPEVLQSVVRSAVAAIEVKEQEVENPTPSED